MNPKLLAGAGALAIVCLVALVYWPAHIAGFIWDDKVIFHDSSWLRAGDHWKAFSFQHFYEWANYFRPLVVALFVAEIRIFGVEPGPMHLVSLALHLANTLLVGLLARNLSARATRPRAIWFAGGSMLLYGLHPGLIEPVVWISAQFDLVVTFFMLLGLLLNDALRNSASRAFAVATCFFLAACTKESAVSFPLLLVLFDWIRMDPQQQPRRPMTELRSLWRQWPVYAGVLVAGVAYLALRLWTMGFLVQPIGSQSLLSLARWQTVSFTYLTFWRIITWPMYGLGPTHVVDTVPFATLGAATAMMDVAALMLVAGGLYYAWKRRPLGYVIVAVTAALLPALHIIPIDFNPSLYHERYAMLAVAMACALLPLVVSTSLSGSRLDRSMGARVAVSVLALAWLSLAIVNIRVTLPLWSDEAKLWLWALREYPQSIEAKDHLLSTYLERNDRQHARQLADALLLEKLPCTTCMINIANLALADGDPVRAAAALEKAKQTLRPGASMRAAQAYVLAMGQLLELQHDQEGAEAAYREAIALEPLDPRPQMALALVMARQGRADEARQQADAAVSLLAPDERDAGRKRFEAVLAASTATRRSPAEPVQ